MYVRMYVCMYVCTYVYIYIHAYVLSARIQENVAIQKDIFLFLQEPLNDMYLGLRVLCRDHSQSMIHVCEAVWVLGVLGFEGVGCRAWGA